MTSGSSGPFVGGAPASTTWSSPTMRWGQPIVAIVMVVAGVNMLDTGAGFAAFVMLWMVFVVLLTLRNMQRVPWRIDIDGRDLVWRSWFSRGTLPIDDVVRVERYRNGGHMRLVFGDGGTFAVSGGWPSTRPLVDVILGMVPNAETTTYTFRQIGDLGYRKPR